MSDLSIPGVTDKYSTQKVIDALMAVKKEPLTRMQTELGLEQQKKTAWQDITKQISGLRDAARTLFGFQNPFNDRVATSSDEGAFTATATRQAAEQNRDITVKQVATADRFTSRSLPRDFTVEAGQYTFSVGGKSVSLAWKGGTLKAFVDALNAKGTGILAASIVNDTTTSQVLVVQGKLTGSANRLGFSDKAVDLGLATGMITRSTTGSTTVPLDQKAIAAWTAPLAPEGFQVQNGALTVNPGSELRIPVTPALALNKNMVLELSVRVERLPEPSTTTPAAPPGPAIPPTGGIDYQGIHVEGSPSQTPLPQYQPPQPPENITDLQSLFMESGGTVTPLPNVPDSTDWQKVQVPIGDLASTLNALDVRNRNTYRRIDIKDVSIYDSTQRGGYVPANALSEAGDALLSMDGVDVKRGTNTIDDLIPGVTLNLKGPSSGPVQLSVTHDVDSIKKQLINLVGTYNGIILGIDVLTRKDDTIVSDATWLTDDERKKDTSNLGLMAGDLSLQQLKSSMQQVMMNPYPTSLGQNLALLAQIGVSTDNRAPGSGGIDKTRLRGYLDVDEQKLTAALQDKPEAIKQLFGNDTTGDLIVDAGVAYSLDALLRPYVQTGGILASRVTTLDSQIKDSNTEIADYKVKLDDYQAQLKQKYAQMSSALDQMQQSSNAINNFNKQNNGSSSSGQ